MRNLITVLLVFVLTAGCASGSGENSSADSGSNNANFARVAVGGENIVSGIFDPAVEYGADGVGWMTYSWVNWPKYVESHLARSDDHGVSWNYVSTLNNSIDSAVGSHTIVWRYETSTILYDPSDVAARRWKFFAARVPAITPCSFEEPCVPIWSSSYIVYRTAASPEGPWSNEICLLGSNDSECGVNINNLDSSLSQMAFYNELGSIVVNGVIYLSLDAGTTANGLGDWERRKVILISSADGAVTWNYVGTLTDFNDANNAGYAALTATSLVEQAGRLYLLISPSGSTSGGRAAHDGVYVVEFEDITQARLKRHEDGQLLITKTIRPSHDSGGPSDYDEQNTNGQIVFSELNLNDLPEFFQIYNVGIRVE